MSEETGESVHRISVKEVAASFGGSAMTGAAKASPGVAVGAGAAEFLSTSVQDLITWGTLVYSIPRQKLSMHSTTSVGAGRIEADAQACA